MNNKHIIPLITASTHLPRAGIAITPEIEQHIEQGAVIAFSISGGKDGTAAVLSTEAELRRRGHASQRVLIHSHLGQIEHGDALASCQRLATMTGLELIVIDAPGGGMIPAWRRRWQRNVQRYIESTFSFQEKRWLADVASHLLNDSDREQLERAKDKAARRAAAEQRIPKVLLYTEGWPTKIPTQDEARLISEIRHEVADIMQLPVLYLAPDAIITRFEELIEEKRQKEQRKRKKKRSRLAIDLPHQTALFQQITLW